MGTNLTLARQLCRNRAGVKTVKLFSDEWRIDFQSVFEIYLYPAVLLQEVIWGENFHQWLILCALFSPITLPESLLIPQSNHHVSKLILVSSTYQNLERLLCPIICTFSSFSKSYDLPRRQTMWTLRFSIFPLDLNLEDLYHQMIIAEVHEFPCKFDRLYLDFPITIDSKLYS